jgi:hypothetical protein
VSAILAEALIADFREESNLPIPHPISFAKRPIVPDFFGL